MEAFLGELVALAEYERIDGLAEAALTLLHKTVAPVEVVYFEINDDALTKGQPAFWRGDATTAERQLIRERISKGIVARAVTEGRIVSTPSALEDPRFHDLGSVKQNEIGAALCVPIGGPSVTAVLYAQRRGATPFSVAELELAQVLARFLGALLDRFADSARRLPLRASLNAVTQRRFREAFQRHDGNISAVARELGISRSRAHRLMVGDDD